MERKEKTKSTTGLGSIGCQKLSIYYSEELPVLLTNKGEHSTVTPRSSEKVSYDLVILQHELEIGTLEDGYHGLYIKIK